MFYLNQWSRNLFNKIEIRQQLCEKRKKVTPEQRQLAAEKAKTHLITHQIFQQSQHIGCYLARQDEFDCQPVIQAIWQAQKNCYVPVMKLNSELMFVEYKSDTPLSLNTSRILEPSIKDVFSTCALDLVLVPLVGFDQQGHRLGMGGGYYDKTFSFLLQNPGKPILLGLAYQLQQVETLLADAWDVPLDGVLTEEGVFFF